VVCSNTEARTFTFPGVQKAKEPELLEVAVGPAVVIGSTTSTFEAAPLSQDGPQSHADPSIDVSQHTGFDVFEVANHQLRLDAESYLLSISQISTPVLPNSDSTQKWPNHRSWIRRRFISTDQPISEIAKAPIAVLTCHKSESANFPSVFKKPPVAGSIQTELRGDTPVFPAF
jgi:hypothetical protein